MKNYLTDVIFAFMLYVPIWRSRKCYVLLLYLCCMVRDMGRKLVFGQKQIENIYSIESQIIETAGKLGYDEDACFSLRLALDEALVNAIIHGNGNAEDKEIMVIAECDEEKFTVTVCDEGDGFDCTKLYDPRQEPYLHNCNGRGLFLIRQFTHNVFFNEKGNEITFSVNRNQPISVLQAAN